MCEPNKKSPLDDTNKSIKADSSKPQKSLFDDNNLYYVVTSFVENLKNIVKKYCNNLKSLSTSNEVLNLLTTAEKLVTDFYGGIMKKVSHFVETELQKFKTINKEEAEKSKKILVQYSGKLQQISEKKIKKILEVKQHLRMNIFKIEEFYSITKLFEEKMTEVKILTEKICKSLSKKQTLPFVKDLQKTVETRSNEMKVSFDLLLGSAKEKIPKIQNSLKSINTQDIFTKMPNFLETLKLFSASLSQVLVPQRSGRENSQGTTETVAKKSMSNMGHDKGSGGENFKGLAKYFNSHTDFGRANVSKATLISAALIGAYLYLKPSKKTAPK